MANRTNDKIEKQIIDYYSEGYGVMELSEQFQLHRCTIQRILHRNNIKLRKRTPGHYDIHFFDEYSVDSCYWAGFIAADGYVRSDRANVSIHLSVVDIEHLKKLEKLTNYTGKITVYDNECCLSFAGEWFPKALAKNFEIYPRKTFDIMLSDKIPKDMIPHFLRGYFDGDGCVTNVGEYLRISFTSGSVNLLKQISDFLYNHGVRVRNEFGVPKISNNCFMTYNCKNAQQILELLYADSTDSTRLDRKYQRYLQYKLQPNKEIPIFTQDRDYIENTFKIEEELK